MATPETDHLLELVRKALDDIDERPVSVTARRTARVASMLGETQLAVRLGLELKPLGGHPPSNAEDTRRLVADPSLWGDTDGPAEQAMVAYTSNRSAKDGPNAGLVLAFGLAELEQWIDRSKEFSESADALTNEVQMSAILERVRHTCFSALCAWERQLTYANTNERIFERFRDRVDAVLAGGAPDVLDQFSAVYRRLRDAASIPDAPIGEELSQAVTTCRRILKAVADHLQPGAHGAKSSAGHSLDDSAYRNRLYEYLKAHAESDTSEAAIRAALGGVYERFEATDKLASKGVHADVGLADAELCAINTYMVAGELLSIAAAQT